jgi:hypothetical protein
MEKKVLGPTIKNEKVENKARKGSDASSKAELSVFIHKHMK